MKEQTLIEMKNKIETLGKAVQFLMREVPQLKDLAVGTLETIKQMDDYEQAIEDLKKKMAEESSKAKEADANRETVK
jgi:cell shape-determining protein MreC